jgi:hypothetical protein
MSARPRYAWVSRTKTQILTFGSDYTNAIWNKFNVTITPNATTDPITGAVDATLVVPTTLNATHGLLYASSAFASLDNYTLSFFLKRAGYHYARVQIAQNPNAFAFGAFDLSAGIITSAGMSSGDPSRFVSAGMLPAGNDWYNCSVTANGFTASPVSTPEIVIANTPLSTVFPGDGVSGVYVWGGSFLQWS